VLRSPNTVLEISPSSPDDVSGQDGGSPLIEIQTTPVCSPLVSSVRVNGQNSNTVIAGTSGFVSILGTCLGSATAVSLGSGITVTSLQYTDSDIQLNAYYQSNSGIAGGSRALIVFSPNGSATSQIFVTAVSLQSFTFNETVPYKRDCFGAAAPPQILLPR